MAGGERRATVDAGASVEHSIIGPGAVVATGAMVRDSAVLPGAVVGAGAVVEGSIVGPGPPSAPTPASPASRPRRGAEVAPGEVLDGERR